MSAPRTNQTGPAGTALPRRSWLAALALVVAVLSVALPLPAAESPVALEYKVKAGYLYNFAKYVEWPDTPARSGDNPSPTPLVIGVLGGQEVLPILQQVLHGKTVEGRPLLLKAVTKLNAEPGCHILFVHRSAGQAPAQIRQSLGQAPVLLVGETEGFAEEGGMIGFVREDESFRIRLNLEASNQAGLKVSAKLSSIARLVKTRPQP
ncbi:MAG: hypothetical protein RJA22_2805 [Verrucomicrobiota bacterium]